MCAAGASPVAGVSFSTFVRFHSLSHRILLLSLSMNLQQLIQQHVNALEEFKKSLKLRGDSTRQDLGRFASKRLEKPTEDCKVG